MFERQFLGAGPTCRRGSLAPDRSDSVWLKDSAMVLAHLLTYEDWGPLGR